MKFIIHIITLMIIATACGTSTYVPLTGKLNDSQYHAPKTLGVKTDTPEKVRTPGGQVRFVTPTTQKNRVQESKYDNHINSVEEGERGADYEAEIIAIEDVTAQNEYLDPSSRQAQIVEPSKDNQHPSKTSHNPFVNNKLVVDLDKEASNFTYPIDGKYSSGYGARGRGWHSGVDLTAPAGTPIYAAFDGKVRMSKPYGGYGNYIVITHDNGLETAYSHNSKNIVVEGQRVKSGQKIALCGRTGRASGNHLHFEVRVSGVTLNPNLLINYTLKNIQQGKLTVIKNGSKISASRNNNNANIDNIEKPLPPKKEEVVGAQNSTIAPVGNNNPTNNTTSKPTYHTIVKGDTLYSIAKRNGTTVDKICALNNIQKNIILRIGAKIRLK